MFKIKISDGETTRTVTKDVTLTKRSQARNWWKKNGHQFKGKHNRAFLVHPNGDKEDLYIS